MFNKEKIDEIVRGELRAIFFLEGEDNGVFLNLNGLCEEDEGEYCTEEDVSWHFTETLEMEVVEAGENPPVRQAIHEYFNKTVLRPGETIEYRFGFDLGTERINGLGFEDSDLDEETVTVLTEWAESLGRPGMYLGSDLRVHATW